jgi:Subtilase family
MRHITFFLKSLAFSLTTLLVAAQTNAQTIASFSFDNAASMAAWQISPPNNGAAWDWSSNGTASGTPFWGGRPRIKSASLGGAVLLTMNPSLTAAATLTSPDIAIVPTDTLFLSFQQYFRNFSNLTKTKVQISTDGGLSFSDLPILLNKDISKNTETDYFDRAIVQLPQGAAASIKIRFTFDGNAYFWLLDDIKITKNYPSPTLPRVALGEFLYKNQYPYQVDSAGHAYKTNALLVHIPTGTTQTEIDDFLKQRNLKRNVVTKKCNCELQLEEWEVVPFNPDQIPGNGNGNGNTSTTKITGTFDYYVFNDLLGTGCMGILNTKPLTETVLLPFTTAKPKPSTGKIVAILDSGLDFNHKTGWFASKIAPNTRLTRLNDVLGYNFIDDNNNISDNHGHGTHITGIITQLLDRAGAPYQLLPVKTHDHRDISTLFEVTCGTYYAVARGASVLNCSWGYYGNSDTEATPLSIAIRFANTKNATIVAATGNDALQLDAKRNIHLPANYSTQIPNVVSVTSTEIVKKGTIDPASPTPTQIVSGLQVSSFANYSAKIVDIGASGRNISSTLPCKGLTPMSGTSMAAPVVASRLLLLYNTASLRSTPASIKMSLLSSALSSPLLTNKIILGKYIP